MLAQTPEPPEMCVLPIYAKGFVPPQYENMFWAMAPYGNELLVVPIAPRLPTALMNLVLWTERAALDLARLNAREGLPGVRWRLLGDALAKMRAPAQVGARPEVHLAALLHPMRAAARDTLEQLLGNPTIAAPALLNVLVEFIDECFEQAKQASPCPAARLEFVVEFAFAKLPRLHQHARAHAHAAMHAVAPTVDGDGVGWVTEFGLVARRNRPKWPASKARSRAKNIAFKRAEDR